MHLAHSLGVKGLHLLPGEDLREPGVRRGIESAIRRRFAGPTTKGLSRLVRWAAAEAVQFTRATLLHVSKPGRGFGGACAIADPA
jgi:hypothetical protein